MGRRRVPGGNRFGRWRRTVEGPARGQHQRAHRTATGRALIAGVVVAAAVAGVLNLPRPSTVSRTTARADDEPTAASLAPTARSPRLSRVDVNATDRAIEAPTVFDAPPAPAAAPPMALRSSTAKAAGTWAVVVGINDYPGSRSDLKVAVADAVEVDRALAGYGVAAERRLVLRDTQATAAVIKDSLRWLVDHAAADATVVFFYAGHVRKVGTGREAIVAADGRLVHDTAVAEVLRPLEARSAWITIAACYGGGFTEVLAPGRVLTAAADANHLAYENPAIGLSYLAEYMIRQAMVDGHAAASVEQSFAWASDRLRAEHPDRVPVQYDQFDGDLELGTVPAPAPAPAASDPPGEPTSPEPNPAAPPPREPDGNGDCLITLGTIAGCPDRTGSR